MTSPNEIARRIALNVASFLNYVPALIDNNFAAVIEEITVALCKYGQKEYARGLIERHKPGDPLCEKCDEAGYRRGIEEAVRVVIDYRSNGHYATGHGFMSDLDEIVVRIGKLQCGTGGGE